MRRKLRAGVDLPKLRDNDMRASIRCSVLVLGAVLSLVVAGPSPSAAAEPEPVGVCSPPFMLKTIADAVADLNRPDLEPGFIRADGNDDGYICIKSGPINNSGHPSTVTWHDNNRQKGKGDGDA